MTSGRLNLERPPTPQTAASPVLLHDTTPVYQTNLVPISDTLLHGLLRGLSDGAWPIARSVARLRSGKCRVDRNVPEVTQSLLRHNMDMARITELDVNGSRKRIDADSDRTLLSVLRDDLDLTGTKYGCGEGQCAACTVLIDGVATRACLTKVGTVSGKRIVTIEGLAHDGHLHPVQEAFLNAGAMQCGWCTPGMIMGAVSLLARNTNPSNAEIVTGMNGHICRCGTYPQVIAAIRAASGKGGRA